MGKFHRPREFRLAIRGLYSQDFTASGNILIAMARRKRTGSVQHVAGNAPLDWESALAEHGRWLRSVVLARVGRIEAVDEVMQEVALAAVRQQEVAEVASVAPWLYRVAVRQALLYRRRLGRERRRADHRARQNTDREQLAHEPNPLDWLLAAEHRLTVRDALQQLTRRDAEILLLKYTENWSYREIAEHLGISHSAVEARLHRARQHLRSALAVRNVTGVTP
jgi:RNA polymerase sigma-70 factor (ECF subfamily)